MSRRAFAFAVVVLALAGCAGDGRADGGTAASSRLTVSVAASLGATFQRLAREFEATHPGVDVTLNAGASSALAQQVVAGAPVDVFAAANIETMRPVTRARAARGKPTVFARNVLQIAVPAGNPGGVRGLGDLARSELVVALCAEQVPCGSAAARALAAGGVHARPDTFEHDAQATVTKVRLGEVDAALVYRTDVLAAAPEVEGIEFPEAEAAVNDYLITQVNQSAAPALAAAFVDFVLGPAGQHALTDAGFRTP